MPTYVVMPRLSDTMKEGMIARWLKAEGDAVSRGDPLVEIQSDKATLEVEAFESGVLRRIVAQEGAVVPLGETIAVIGDREEALPDLPSAAPQPEAAAARSDRRVKVSPLAKKMAARMGIDLASVAGTGSGGRIVKRDILAAAEQPPAQPAPAEAQAVALSPMRKIIAQRMAESKANVPHFYITIEVDMARALDLREQLNARCEDRLRVTINDLVIKAAASALAQFPDVNSSFDRDRVVRHGQVHVGVAVDVADGLLVPVVRDCDRKSLSQISAEVRDLVARGREGKLAPEEYTGGTFTISNMGMFRVEDFAAIINPPEAALLAVGSVRRVPVVQGDAVVPGDRMKLTLSGDHRVMNGVTAAKFLNEVRRLLEQPFNLLV